MPVEPRIIDRGRGPAIEGTRITVYDIMDYYKHGYHHTLIAAVLLISSSQVLAAVKYIEEHKEQVMAEYQKILDRHQKGNPPEIQAKLDRAHERAMARLAELRRQKEAERARIAG